MKNRKNRIIHVAAATLLSYNFESPRYKQAVYDRKGNLYGASIGTSVRPQIVPVNTSTGDESVAQFIARGGVVTVGRTVKAHGFVAQGIRVKPFRNVPTNCRPARS